MGQFSAASRWLLLFRPLAPLAQLAEQLTLNQRVVGSSPTRCTKCVRFTLRWVDSVRPVFGFDSNVDSNDRAVPQTTPATNQNGGDDFTGPWIATDLSRLHLLCVNQSKAGDMPKTRIATFASVLTIAIAVLAAPAWSAATPSWTARAGFAGDSQYSLGSSDDGQTIAVSGWTYVNVSRNGGDTFDQLTPSVGINFAESFVSPDGQTIWVNTLSVDSNAGLWTIDSSGIFHAKPALPAGFAKPLWQFHVSRDQQLVVATDNDGSTWISKDSATTWTKVNKVFMWGVGNINSDKEIWISDEADGGRLWRSTDLGATWTDRTPPSAVSLGRVVSSAGGTVVVTRFVKAVRATDTELSVSTDDGMTWRDIPTSDVAIGTNSFYPAISESGKHIVVGNQAKAYLSDDFGATWTLQTIVGLNARVMNAFSDLGGGLMMLVKQNKNVYVLDRRPEAPTGITAGTVTATTASISWTAANAASPAGYLMEYRLSSSSGSWVSQQVADFAATSGVLTGLPSGQTYSVRVRTMSDFGLSAPSAEITVTTPAMKPAKPKVASAKLSKGKAVIVWTAMTSGVSVTKAEYCLAKCTKTSSWKKAATNLTVSLMKLKKGTKYSVSFRVTTAAGVSPVAVYSFKGK